MTSPRPARDQAVQEARCPVEQTDAEAVAKALSLPPMTEQGAARVAALLRSAQDEAAWHMEADACAQTRP